MNDTGTASPAARNPAAIPLAGLFHALASSAEGLSGPEAASRLLRDGPNEARQAGRHGVIATLLSLFANPLVVILLLAAGVSGFLGDWAGAAIIVAIVLLSVTLNFALSYRSQQAANRLREEIAPMATVLRDGRWQERPRRELVVGDVIRLCAGNRVPADARLIDARDLHVQQAALTGESAPAAKESVAGADGANGADARQLVFLGTSVVAGTATALVFATGRNTAFGDVAETLSERPPQTEFERGLADFSRLIMRTVVFLLLGVLLAGVVLHRPPLETLLFALALAVGLTPEFMPMITTVTLARGAVRMARRRVIVKHLAAIEDFGSMTVLLSDKTGTLTSSETAVAATVDPFGEASTRTLLLAQLNAAFETGIRSPLDAAILRHATLTTDEYRKLDEIPFDFERRRLCVVLQHGDERLLVVKGAPESVLAACTQYEVGGMPRPLDDDATARCTRCYEAFGEQGLRVLAVAYRNMPVQDRYTVVDETALVLAGFVTFADPVIPGVADCLRALARDGIAVKILTGDNEKVARHVCEEVGIDASQLVTGTQLDGLGEAALGALAERTNVFARVSPAQKHRIVLALKGRNSVVGFLGDGINDAPSLHAADVGISVADAVDVARDAADIVLRERDLGILHAGVIEGRRAFANVMKYLLMGTSSNFGNMFSMAAGTLFLPFLPMLPTQILLNNFLYDLAQTAIPTDNVDEAQLRRPRRWSVAVIRRFMLGVGPISSLYDFATFYVLLHWLHASEAAFHTGWFIESLATQTLVLFVIRTAGHPLRSRPSPALAVGVLAALAIGMVLPWTPLAPRLGMTPLPAAFFVFLLAATATYLLLVELAKRRFMDADEWNPAA
ncbi:magnesium-translocating P-type ATPase [Rhodanobacter thiooxydans]|uniref:magnesium-translocating P-type ATPase n=1 Tax=Rhodanobacter thiooxydans TaxID=416169 RepID=UPI000260D611|nr:magnesium-translocating P-type ATPase [Rhodanobacter thiooxydans]EIL98436.1 magnesium-translocating P-type ATPase [Rhodanobacter thiooxydans LCS2]